MPNAYASQLNLQQMHTTLTSTSVTSAITGYLEGPSQTSYDVMVTSITKWITSDVHLKSIGLTSADTISGLRLIVADSTGSRVYDSLSSTNNTYNNIDVPAKNFMTSGQYMIGKNMNTWPNVMQALLSQSGFSFHARYNTTAKAKILVYTVRIGSPNEPIGTIVLSMIAPDA
jgi:hypothetical protein